MVFAFLTYLSLLILFGRFEELVNWQQGLAILLAFISFLSIFVVYTDSNEHFLIGLFKLFFFGLSSFVFHYVIPVISFIIFLSWYFFGDSESFFCNGLIEAECGMVINQTGIYWKGIVILMLTFYILLKRFRIIGQKE